jgi:hypothetical protein
MVKARPAVEIGRRHAGGAEPRTAPRAPNEAGTERALFGLPSPFGLLLLAWLTTAAFLSAAFTYALSIKFSSTEAHFFRDQDLPVLGLCILITLALAFVPAIRAPALRASMAASPWAWTLGLALVCGAAGVIGARVVFQGYLLSLDEHLADFDARIFAHGRLMAPVGPTWRPFAYAMQPLLTVIAPDGSLWSSTYLPVNAALRAIAGELGLQAWLNPLLSAFSVAALFGVARRLWPERPSMALGAAALLASSSQLVVMSMTAYAMPAHLAFNLGWLWLFLRGGKLGHAGALVVGFLATGLHQILFHPLFVAPFVLQLWLDRRWRLAALYTLAYGAIGLFWIEYWSLDYRVSGFPTVVASATAGGFFRNRVLDVFSTIHPWAPGSMALALVRFVTWQNPLTVSLALVGVAAAVRAKGIMRALVLGIALTLLAALIVVPTQIHGWGYRYLHGLLGSFSLLAMWSWTRLTDGLAPERRAAAWSAFAVSCAVSLLALTPLRAWQAWSYVRPYAMANAQIQSSPAQVVLVVDKGPFGFDPGTLLRNDPYLTHWPRLMLLAAMDDATVRQVCSRYTVTIFDGANARAVGIDSEAYHVAPHLAELQRLLGTLHCGSHLPARSQYPVR